MNTRKKQATHEGQAKKRETSKALSDLYDVVWPEPGYAPTHIPHTVAFKIKDDYPFGTTRSGQEMKTTSKGRLHKHIKFFKPPSLCQEGYSNKHEENTVGNLSSSLNDMKA